MTVSSTATSPNNSATAPDVPAPDTTATTPDSVAPAATSANSSGLPATRPKTALIVIDVQNGVMDASWNSPEVVARISELVARARENGTEVIWVRHSSDELPAGSPQWQIVNDLVPTEAETIIEKTHGSTFEDTDFAEVLTAKDIGHLVVSGAQSDACVRSTIHGGFARGFHVTLVSDAHTTEDLTPWGAPPPESVVNHTNLYWGFESGPGRTARTQETAEVDFTPPV